MTNIFLFLIKVVAYLDSGSLAVLASVLDSALDLLSGAVVYFTSVMRRDRDPYSYPGGVCVEGEGEMTGKEGRVK